MCVWQAREGGNMTAVTTKTQNVHGDELIVTTTSPYEAEVFASRADWRVSAVVVLEVVETDELLVGDCVLTPVSMRVCPVHRFKFQLLVHRCVPSARQTCTCA
jgi:hypothetical protein